MLKVRSLGVGVRRRGAASYGCGVAWVLRRLGGAGSRWRGVSVARRLGGAARRWLNLCLPGMALGVAFREVGVQSSEAGRRGGGTGAVQVPGAMRFGFGFGEAG